MTYAYRLVTRRIGRSIAGILAAMLLAGPGACAQAASVIELSAGLYRIEAEAAATFADRAQGLMGRQHLPPQRGMLFVFPEAGTHCMWMRNTLIPLSVAFIDDKGVIINVEDMQPQTLDNHCAAKPVRYALEMNHGWFRQRNIGRGSRILGLERAPTPR